MHTDAPPVVVPQPKPIVQYVKREWSPLQVFKTEKAARDYIAKNGGFYSYGFQHVVIYIPVKK